MNVAILGADFDKTKTRIEDRRWLVHQNKWTDEGRGGLLLASSRGPSKMRNAVLTLLSSGLLPSF